MPILNPLKTTFVDRTPLENISQSEFETFAERYVLLVFFVALTL